jgi:hypothetical protein
MKEVIATKITVSPSVPNAALIPRLLSQAEPNMFISL